MDFKTIASPQSVKKTSEALIKNNFEPIFVSSKEEALQKIKEIIPDGASLMNGSSETLRQIGFVDLLKSGKHPWNNLHDAVLLEKDPEKQKKLRRESVLSDFYLGSAHALTEEGEIVVASNTGSQLSHIVYTSPNLIFVVGAQKIVPTLSDALRRIDEYVFPLEDARMKSVYGYGSSHSKTTVLHKESPGLGRKIRVIIVNESLGF